jgi:predicted lipoprotein with Yx(FWY)xxD motif
MTAVARGNRRLRRALVLPVLALAVVGLSACGQDVDLGPKPSLAGANTVLGTVDGFYGRVVADGAGRTLYQFSGDRNGESTCYGPCAETWRPYIAEGQPGPAYANLTALEKSEIDLVPRQDGQQQVRYAGHPLYFYSGDAKAADITGAGKTEFGGKWTGVTTLGNPVLP